MSGLVMGERSGRATDEASSDSHVTRSHYYVPIS